ncbi:MAG: hypothetical protein LQ348_002284 [Seirophora lacunosa]|nr:MAG: hypothetical protein LQ348_002284 [Seirophora lacunosa]
MSSPFLGPYNGHPNQSAASSPRLAPRPQPSQDLSVRPMKLLYTFDHENKTNCLARWPQNIDIRTANLDENTQIGVIELKTCIQAIVAASPELVAKLGQDYTVYAYDYSEYDTPQVGQGMLSWVLASSSSTPSAPAHQSKTMVTGRVCKNIMGLFSDSAQETLEVKLRLVPVPSFLQSEYIESMKSYRDLSRVMPEGFDSQAWTNFLQANPGITQLLAQSRSVSPGSASGQRNTLGIENVQRLMNHNRTSPERSDHVDQNIPSQSDSYTAAEAIEQLPRPSSSASDARSTAPPKKARGRPPKAWNELSDKERKKRRARTPRQESSDVGYGSYDDQREDAPNKKRAKVMRAEYPGASGFGKQPELRVAASTAASLRIYQPTAIRPSNPTGSALEGPPREPTPVARPSNAGSRPLLPARPSNLRCESLVPKVSTHYESPYPPLDAGKGAESEKSSPEGSRADSANTPADFASSPPAYPGSTTAPSSPRLPTLPLDMDSGIMSCGIDDLFEDDEYRPLEDEDMDVAARYMKRADLHVSESAGKVTPHDSGFESPGNTQGQENSALQEPGSRHCSDSAPHPPNCAMLNRTGSSGDLPQLPAFSNQDVRPSLLHRSQTWAGHQEEHPSSDVIATSEVCEPVPTIRSRNRIGSGSGMKRKQAIQSKLAETVAKGEMPPFCENCGAIETPTWRKAWMKVHSGTPENVVLSDEDGGIVAWQALQTDINGHVCLFRIIKRNLLPEDAGFTESLLCNPCGIWLHTRKCMRPKEVWDKTQGPDGGAGGARRRASQAKKGKSDSLSYQSASEDASGGSTFSDGSSPADADGGTSEHHASELPTTMRPRASSVQAERSKPNRTQLNKSYAAAALQRAIQSSPVRCRSGQQPSSLGKDLIPRPTRRVLFPSPTHRGQCQPSQDLVSDLKDFAGALKRHSGDEFDPSDKENLPPCEDDEEKAIFDELPQRSVTPTPRAKAGDMAFKTPDRSSTSERIVPTTGDFFSSAVKALLGTEATPERGRSRSDAPQPLSEISPFSAQINSLLSDANMHSPSGSRFKFPSLPSLSSTPHRVRQDFDFSHFDPQDLLSTDMPMASSPPIEGWFGVYEDPVEGDATFWNDFPFPGSSPPATGSGPSSAKKDRTPTALCVDDSGRARLDFSAMAGGSG